MSNLKEDLEKVAEYLKQHSGRLTLDIKNANKKHNKEQINFYEGAKSATDIAVTLLTDVLKRNSFDN